MRTPARNFGFRPERTQTFLLLLARAEPFRRGTGAAAAQIRGSGCDEQLELEALRPYGPPKAAPALLRGTPTLPVGGRYFQAETAFELASLAPGAVHLVDVAVPGVGGATAAGAR